jgi:uncharacterized MnhB-related membrane protein
VTGLQAATLIVVVVTGTAVAVLGDPLRQTLVLAIYGFALTVLFFVFQAPDVALSELVVSGVALPVIILAALRKVAQQTAQREGEEEAQE